jgi:MFS family permease
MTWPWIFYINIPIGLGAAYATWSIYRERETPTRALPIDRIGLALLVLWVGSLQLMLDRGKELDWFSSGEIITLAVLAVVGLAFFLVWELTEERYSRGATSALGWSPSRWRTGCSSATSSSCRCGCRPSSAIPPPMPG